MKRVEGSAGSALVEVLLLMLVTFVPLMMLIGALARVHQAALAITSAAREAGTAATSGVDISSARTAAASAAHAVVATYGIHPAAMKTSVTTSTRFDRGAAVTVRTSYPVRVIDIPFIVDTVGPSIWIRASHTAYLHPYRSAP